MSERTTSAAGVPVRREAGPVRVSFKGRAAGGPGELRDILGVQGLGSSGPGCDAAILGACRKPALARDLIPKQTGVRLDAVLGKAKLWHNER
jgi:hypothetical protein